MATGGRRRGLIFIVLALLLIVALVAVAFVFRNQITAATTRTQPQVAQQPAQKMIGIVITTQAVPRGTTITESVLTTIPYPEKDLVAGTFFSEVKDVVGKQAKFDLDPRIPITSSMLVSGQVGSNAAFQIPRGLVAISIPITRLTAVSFAPVAGDHVNVIASMLLVDVDQNFQSKNPNFTAAAVPPGPASDKSPGSLTVSITSGGANSTVGRVDLDQTLNQPLYIVPSEKQRPRLVSQTIIQDAIVLRVGNFPVELTAKVQGAPEPTPTPAPAAGVATPAPPVVPEVITLIVRPQDAVTLNYLMLADAKLNLVLRSAGDTDSLTTDAVTLQFLMEQYNIPNPQKLPFSFEPRNDTLLYPKDDAAPARVGTPVP